MNLTEERKAPLREKRLDEKRELLAMQFKGSIQVCGQQSLLLNNSDVFNGKVLAAANAELKCHFYVEDKSVILSKTDIYTVVCGA